MSGGTRSYEMARCLLAKGHEVNMVTSWRETDSRNLWFITEEEGISVHWLPVPYSNHMSYPDRIQAFIKFAFFSSHKAASLEADVIFATSTPLTIAIPAVYAAQKRKVPMVFEVRDLWPELPIAIGALHHPLLKLAARWLERRAYFNAEAVVALSPGMKEGVEKTGYPASRVAVIPNSSDNSLFNVSAEQIAKFRRERPWLKHRPMLLYAGALGKINGVGYLVELAQYLQQLDPEIRILIVGDGFEKETILRKARFAGVWQNNLFWEPPVPKHKIPQYFCAAQMSANLTIDEPTVHANSANKFFDTISAAKPVFINGAGWQADLVKHIDCGIAAWNVPIEKVAELVVQKIRDPHWLQAAGGRSRLLAEQHFDRDLLAGKLEQLLMSAAQGKGEMASQIAPDSFSSLHS